MNLDKYLNNLNNGWDFSKEKTNSYTHSIHPYPAKFIPQIPRKAIIKFTKEGENVLDIFCGSGTTLVEANLLNRNSYGIDVNPIAILIAKTKTLKLNQKEFNEIEKWIKESRPIILSDLNKYKKINEYGNNEKLFIPDFYNRDHWFEKHVSKELAILLYYINKIDNMKLELLLKCALSSIVVRVSNQDSDTRYSAINKKQIGEGDTVNIFFYKLKGIIRAIKDYTKHSTGCEVKLLHDDSRIFFPELKEQINLIVTSPPYLNTYDYHKYHRQRMHWLNLDFNYARVNELGGHDKYTKKNSNPETFFSNMKEVFKNTYKYLKSAGIIMIITGDAIIRGKLIDVPSRYEDLLKEIGYSKIEKTFRNININKKSFNRNQRIKKENILIYKK